MILTLTPNPALDVTYSVDALTVGASHRVRAVTERAGGKGINVASVLLRMGHEARAYGPVGGTTGAQLRADLISRGISEAMTTVESGTRHTVTVVADGDATVLNEPGACSAADWSRVVADLRSGLESASAPGVLVASGSLPSGVDESAYADVVTLAHEYGWRCIIDTSGPALLAALAARPDVLKPNHHELAEVAGTDDVVAGARWLQDRGAQTVVVSRGSSGMVLVQGDGTTYAARPRIPLQGNPTGAGDAAVAALAVGLSQGRAGHDLLRTAVGWSSAAVLSPVAGELDPAHAHELSTTALEGDS